MVLFEEVTCLMDKMMNLEIFPPAEKLRMCENESKVLDPNLIMDTRHRMAREDHFNHPPKCLLSTESKRLLQREPTSVVCLKKEQDMLDKELKKFERDLHRVRPKFSGPYVCSKRNMVCSDDEEFWKISRRTKDKLRSEQIVGQKNGRREEIAGSQRKINERAPIRDFSLKSEGKGIVAISKGEMPYFGSIKITVREKLDTNPTNRDLRTLKKYFDALKYYVQEEQRLREIKMKIQENVATRLKKKYFHLWKISLLNGQRKTVEPEERREEMPEERKIDMFINAITERQKELMRERKVKRKEIDRFAKNPPSTENNKRKIRFKQNKVESPVCNRLNTQKRIIEEQRAKLAEQNKIIEEFRLKQAQEEISKCERETMSAAKDALTHCGQKTRRTLIQLMRQAGYRSKSLLEPPRIPSPPKFLLRMEARAEARKERRRMADSARRRKLEEEKNKETAAKIEEEQEFKRLQREAEREARRARKEKEELKLREIEKWKRLNGIADEFYRKYLLRKYIVTPLIMLIEMRDNHTKIADSHYKRRLLKKTFQAWRFEIDNRNNAKLDRAISLYNRKLQSKTIECLKVILKVENAKYQVAKDFYDMKLLEAHFKIWYARYGDIKEQLEKEAVLADKHYELKLKTKYFSVLKNYSKLKAEFEDRVRRKNELRLIVQAVIPDFDPVQKGLVIEN